MPTLLMGTLLLAGEATDVARGGVQGIYRKKRQQSVAAAQACRNELRDCLKVNWSEEGDDRESFCY